MPDTITVCESCGREEGLDLHGGAAHLGSTRRDVEPLS